MGYNHIYEMECDWCHKVERFCSFRMAKLCKWQTMTIAKIHRWFCCGCCKDRFKESCKNAGRASRGSEGFKVDHTHVEDQR